MMTLANDKDGHRRKKRRSVTPLVIVSSTRLKALESRMDQVIEAARQVNQAVENLKKLIDRR